ncbi:DUF429 domain-containing protein [Okeania sp. SIO2B3]|uniref:DUF429 domain-containing protein n=1 Tax=Okeania sp. SIO2B3 TaxID=2607784 RepID=UPI0013BEF7E3|nr:DUF429 domain-containing protein [Okeania sp. SIO2B3]NET43748.1 DUF429 domain-containing protein [Okeania sp. SIO2B3]
MKFIGIDLGWRSGKTGLCCLQYSDKKLKILDLDCILEIEDILNWIDNFTPLLTPALIAVDAPTIIPNQTGTRLPDKLTHKYFGRYHAGCYPANLNRPFAQKTVNFGMSLAAKGFIHAPTIEPQQPGRFQIEVYPHPAIVNLFSLEKILKYKKGKLADRKSELLKLHQYITNILTTLEPTLEISENFLDTENINSIATLKITEDKLDSLICAYIGAYWWYWGQAKNLVLGDDTTGYIVVPERLAPLRGS